MKSCSACKKSYPDTTEHFHRAGYTKKGKAKLDHRCKACNNARRAAQIDEREALAPARVYSLTCLATGEQYIGSTTQTLMKRYWEHKTSANSGRQSNLYHCMRTFEGDLYWHIKELELVDNATCKEDLREREQAWMDHLNPVLNTNRALRVAA